jgi:AcrR family transcriptional regulator
MFMVRAGLSTAAVVTAAIEIIDERGAGALTLAAVAADAGVATPSLYKHVGGLPELRTLVGRRILDELAERFTAAALGRSGEDAVAALMRAYRAYAVERPARYAVMPLDPLHDPGLAESGRRLFDVTLAVLRGCGLTGEPAIHAARCLRTVVHGFASLESGGGFGLPADLDRTYDELIGMVLAWLVPTR